MNEIFDKLIIRIFFTVVICILIFVYKYAHAFLYPSSRVQLFKRFFPSQNSADTIHLFSRLLGLGLIFSNFYFYLSDGITFALFDFTTRAIFIFLLYILSNYIIESIVLYNFDYHDEIIKRKNYSYSVIAFVHSIGIGYLLKTILSVSANSSVKESLVLIVFLWLFSMVLLGFATKTYFLISKLPFNRLLIQKNMCLAFSYGGFFWAWTIVISSSMGHYLENIKWFAIQVILKILLASIIFPIFRKGLIWTFKIQDDLTPASKADGTGFELGYGIYEGVLFLTAAFLTTVITEQIRFGTFYPVF